MIDVREYCDPNGVSPFANWFARLNPIAAAKVATALTRLAAGNFSNVKGVRIQNRLRTWLSGLSREGRRAAGHCARWWNKEAPAARYQSHSCQLAGLQTEKEGGRLWL